MRRSNPIILGALLAVAALWGCNNANPNGKGDKPEKPPGLEAQPERLAFLCVTPGCDDTQSVNVHVNGTRRAAIKRIILRGEAADDFAFTSSEPAPFVVGANAGFDIEVRYTPKGAPIPGMVELVVTYTDASPEESPDRLEPGELSIPLVRRIVGEPILEATPSALSFGVVPSGETKTLAVHVANAGFGNVALGLESATAEATQVTAELGPGTSLVPGAAIDLPVTFKPFDEGYVNTTLTLKPTSPDVEPAKVQVEGTSLSAQKLAVEPGEAIDFGELAQGKTRPVQLKLVNIGGADLTVTAIAVDDSTGNLSVTQPELSEPIVIAPLERVPVEILVGGTTPGEVNVTVTVSSDDPLVPSLAIHVTGTITQPKLTVTPAQLDFGTVPVGWVMNRPVELKNTGFGKLTVKNITLVAGSSNLFQLASLPALPMMLDRDERVAIDVEFRAETMATFNGWLSVETDDPVNPFQEVPLSAVAGSCEAGCPISHGTPSCTNGACEVGTCDPGWYDTDQSAASGCECKEVGTDPGEFCMDAVDVGTLTDTDEDQAQRTGIVPLTDDVDLYRFYGKDATSVFGEDYKVKIRLDSADPNIRMCVYRHDTGSHDSDCYFSNESCPSNRSYQKNGSYGAEDGADYIIKVFRDPGVGPTCTAYTLFMSNGI
ncbi:MAG: choice-of-anchor D domain-containing protein [Myxococcaceae bacterium]|nr:choice-of-anchor D domain-containing protein [Myxococcaceae bacterium]